MVFAIRWIYRLILGALVIAVFLGGTALWLLTRSIPEYSATYSFETLSKPVEIIRDHANVPHIFGDSDHDVFFALGLAHAQDRLWQMMTMRRTVQGRLSEVFGERTVEIDELLRRYDLYTLAQKSLAAQDEPTRQALIAYSEGVNAWLREIATGGHGRGAPEFFLFPGQIELWQPADSIALLKLMALQLSGHLQNEVTRARLSIALPAPRLRDILPDSPGAAVVSLPDYAALMGPIPNRKMAASAAKEPIETALLSPIRPLALSGASNIWAASTKRLPYVGAILANDPHLAFTAPVIWYLARLSLQAGDVIGASIPGIPAIILGRSERMAWGLTSAYLDDQDIVMELLNPQDPNQYKTPQGWATFLTREDVIKVKDAPEHKIVLQWSESGPVLPTHYYELDQVTPEGRVPAISWSALSGKDTSMMAALNLMQATSIEQALASARDYIAPAQNLVLANKNGDIAFQVIGVQPWRSIAHPTKGRLPAPGEAYGTRWRGGMSYDENPHILLPKTGMLGNTNNKTTDRAFPYHLSYFWGDSVRIKRLERLMKERKIHSRDSFIEAQLDTVSQAMRDILPLTGADLWFTEQPAPPRDTPSGRLEAQRNQIIEMLASWNGEMNEHLAEPLIATAWLNAVQKRLIQDDLGPLSQVITHVNPVFLTRVFKDIEGASAWCDIVQSAVTESCAQISALALDDAIIDLSTRYGANIQDWHWGDAHEVRQDHPVLGQTSLGWLVNIRHSSSGDDFTLQRGRTKGGEGLDAYTNVHGAGFRGVYDLAYPDASVFITSTGQSGHPFSSHYDDLTELWRHGNYLQMSLDKDLAKAASVGTTHLRPVP